MTWLDLLSIRWRKAALPPVFQPAVVAAPQPKAHVPTEYLSLYTYLEHRYASTVVLTFDQMESLMGRSLPAAARTLEWWTVEALPADRHSDTWTAAHRTATPNLAAGTVAFERLP